MLYLERKIDTFLIHWKETKNKSPLIVKGARQVGKTEFLIVKTYVTHQNVRNTLLQLGSGF